MSQAIDDIISGTRTSDSLKYLMYSAHDDSISNGILFLEPIDYRILDIPYASTFIYELHYDA